MYCITYFESGEPVDDEVFPTREEAEAVAAGLNDSLAPAPTFGVAEVRSPQPKEAPLPPGRGAQRPSSRSWQSRQNDRWDNED